jgi:hypothetical protein
VQAFANYLAPAQAADTVSLNSGDQKKLDNWPIFVYAKAVPVIYYDILAFLVILHRFCSEQVSSAEESN